MRMRIGQSALQARAKADIGFPEKWKWVFCHNMDRPGTITTTNDYRKSLPGIDHDYFMKKCGHAAYDFRVKVIMADDRAEGRG